MTFSPANHRNVVKSAGWAAASAVLVAIGGCAGTTLGSIQPGSSRDQVIQALGPPTGIYELRQPSGDPAWLQVDKTGSAARRLEYRGGTYAQSTYMFDFDANDRLLARAQVLDEARFNAIRSGMDQQQVLRALGRPSTIWHLGFQKQNVWAYRYENHFCQWFQVGMGYDGMVVDTAYGPDPICEHLFDGQL